MDFRRRLSGLFASESARAIFLFLGITSIAAAILLVSATIVSAFTRNWSLRGVVAALILFVAALSLYFTFRALLLLVLFFWPFLIAIIVMWAGFRVLIERSKKAKNEPHQTASSLEGIEPRLRGTLEQLHTPHKPCC